MKVRILLALEDPLLRCLLSDRLSQESDLEIVAAVGDPESLVDAVVASRPGVVVLDLSWSRHAGLGVLETLLESVPSATVLTLAPDEPEETQALAAERGARGVVPKAEGITALPEAIRALGRGEVWFNRRLSRRIYQEYHRLVRCVRDERQTLSGLSTREREVLRHVAAGETNRQIAEALHMSVHTAKLHVQKILQKLDVPNRTEAAVVAVREGLIASASAQGLRAAAA